MSEFADASLPRECFYKDFTRHPGECPRCGGALVQKAATYVVGTSLKGKLVSTSLLGSDVGWFCEACPTVVVDTRTVDEVLSADRRAGPWDVWTMAGLVDLDAGPVEDGEVPLGPKGERYRAIRFTSSSMAEPQRTGPARSAAALQKLKARARKAQKRQKQGR